MSIIKHGDSVEQPVLRAQRCVRRLPARMRSHLGLGPMAREMKGSCLMAFSCSRLRSSACTHTDECGQVGVEGS